MAEINGITSPEAINIATRGQVLLERLKSGQAAKFAPFLKRMEVILRMRLAAGDTTSYQAAKVTALLQSIEGDLTAVMGEYRTMLTGDLIDTAIQQAQFGAKTLDHLVTEKSFESFVPTAEQVRSAVLTAPLSVVGYNQGSCWNRGCKIGLPVRLNRLAASSGKDTIRAKRQTRLSGRCAARPRPISRMARLRKSTAAIALSSGTAVQHMSTVARQQTYERNSDPR